MIRNWLMLLLYWGVIVPAALAQRLGRDPLRRSWDADAPSYWAWQAGHPRAAA